MLKKPFIPFYIVAILHIIGDGFSWNLALWTKPLLMPSLLLCFYLSLGDRDRTRSCIRFAFLALVFSTLGDILLQLEQTMHLPICFYIGLGAFLTAQVMYILCFRNIGSISISRYWITIYILYFISFLAILYPGMALGLKIPVTVYGLTLTFMAWNSWRCLKETSDALFAPIGALLFVASDSILAINKFKSPISFAGIWIMVTYILAQYFIVMGVKSRSIEVKS